ncbi:MAG: hypothetical protein IKU15_00125 [Clostridia bacterium]|nr:hypothetical protein [Clostridia bacterium]
MTVEQYLKELEENNDQRPVLVNFYYLNKHNRLLTKRCTPQHVLKYDIYRCEILLIENVKSILLHVMADLLINRKYAIIHHSEMTDCDLYFVSDNKYLLLDNEHLINEFLTSEDEFPELNTIDKANIEYLHEEYDDIPENLIILKRYSYRF